MNKMGKITLFSERGSIYNCNFATSFIIKEETGMTVSRIKFNRTSFFEPSNTLMCNFTAFVKDDSELSPNQ